MAEPVRLIAKLSPPPVAGRHAMGGAVLLLIDPRPDGVFLLRYDDAGACVGDTWHASVREAKDQAAFDYDAAPLHWREVSADVEDAVRFGLAGAGVIVLSCGTSALRMAIDSNGWARLSLLGPPEVALGAESVEVLRRRLCGALRTPDSLPLAGRIEGREVRWVTALAESQTTIYVAGGTSELTLYFQGPELDILGKLKLDGATVAAWLRDLCPR